MMRPDDGLETTRERAVLRRFVTERGPDTGRLVGRLTARGAENAAALSGLLESGAVPSARSASLTSPAGTGVQVAFMIGVSAIGGTDEVIPWL